MAMLLIEGFDQYDDDAEIQRGGWTGSFSSINSSTTVHGTLGRSIQLTSTVSDIRHALPISTATYVVGTAYRLMNGGPSLNPIFVTLENGAVQNTLQLKADGEIEARRGTGTILGTSTGAGIAQGQFYYIEMKIFLHASTGTVDVWVDGANVLSLTSQNTLQTSNAWIDQLELHGQSTSDPVHDDVYVLDDSGSDNTSQLGPVFIELLLPDADGNANNFTRVGGGTNNFEAVDDAAPPDDDTTYNHSATATDQELYGFAAIAGSVGTVFAVEASALVRKEDAGFREIQLRSRSNVTEVDSPNKAMGVTYRYVNHIYENDPDGGTDWDEAAVNAAQFGIVLET
jgi:hypothetical protein